MHIRFGYELIYSTPVPTHMVLMLHTHLGPGQRYLIADRMQLSRSIPLNYFSDGFGNTCTRLDLPSAPRASPPMRSSKTQVALRPRCSQPRSCRFGSCPTRCCSSCSAAATAIPKS